MADPNAPDVPQVPPVGGAAALPNPAAQAPAAAVVPEGAPSDQEKIGNALNPDDFGPNPGDLGAKVLAAGAHIAKDMGRGLVQGAPDAANELIKSAASYATALVNSNAATGRNSPYMKNMTDEEYNASVGRATEALNPETAPQIPKLFETDTTAGKVTESASQFITGMAAFGGVGRALKAITGLHVVGEVAKAGLSNAFAFDDKGPMLADMLRDYPVLANHITPFLMSDPADTEAHARFKRGVEGLGMGLFGEAILGSVRAYKAIKAGNTEAAVAASADAEAAVAKAQDAQKAQIEAAAQSPMGSETLEGQEGPFTPVDQGDGKVATPRVPEPEAATVEPTVTALTPDQVDLYREKLARNEDWLADGGVPASLVQFNNGRFPTTDTIKNTLATLEETVNATSGAMDGTQTLEAARKVADIIGSNTSDFLASMTQTAGDVSRLGSKIIAYGDWYVTQSAKVQQLARIISNKLPTELAGDELMNTFSTELNVLNEGRQLYKQISTGTSRALGSFRESIGVKEGYAGVADPTLYGGDLEKAAQAIAMADGNAAAVTATLRSGPVHVLNSILVHSLLGLPTAVVKGTTDLAMAVITPVQRILSGAYGAIGGGAYGLVNDGLRGAANGAAPGITRMKEGIGLYASYGRYFFDAFNMGGKALRLGNQVLDAEQAHGTGPLLGDGTVFNSLLQGEQGAALVNAIAKVTSLSTRVIGTVDEFSKQLAYRAEVARKGWAEASLDPSLTPEAAQAKVQAAIDNSIGPQGQALDKDSLKFARSQTMSGDPIRSPDDLHFGATQSITSAAMQVANSIPLVRQIQPFIKVISNIQRWQWTYTPGLNLLQKQFTNDLLAGGERTADAVSKMTLGAGIAATGVYLGNAGYITGMLHPDPATQTQVEKLTGQSANSWVIKHPDGTADYVPMNRFADPIGPMLALSADFAKVSHYLSDGDLGAAGSAITALWANQIAQRRWFDGASNAYQAIMGTLDPSLTKGERVQKFIAQYTGGFMPSILANHGEAGDDIYYREIRGWMDGILRKTTQSVNLDPSRNVLGEPVLRPTPIGPGDLSPFQMSHETTDPVTNELGKQMMAGDRAIPRIPYKVGFPGYPQETDLTKIRDPHGFSAYDRMIEMMSQPGAMKDAGGNPMPTIRQTFAQLMAPNAPYWKLSDGQAQYAGSKRAEIDAVFGAYHDAAKRSILAENPEARALAMGSAQNKAAALLGRPLPAPSIARPNTLKEAISPPIQ